MFVIVYNKQPEGKKRHPIRDSHGKVRTFETRRKARRFLKCRPFFYDDPKIVPSNG